MSDAAVHGVTGAARHPERPADLAFLGTGGHPSGLHAARFDTGGHILAAAVVRRDAQPAPLTAAQRVALAGLPDDGARPTPHGPRTRRLPGHRPRRERHPSPGGTGRTEFRVGLPAAEPPSGAAVGSSACRPGPLRSPA
ncbi:hypothetical protein [Streptomyces sp. NPDC007856]|uniref:hypothetical protein n=1 Tax=Streptomyces sp. NPDC007856 TaxID=3364781 RepID=UPI0036CD83F7